MRLRRCAMVTIEPRESLEFDLGRLLGGDDGLYMSLKWVAIAPHLGKEIELSAAEVALLGTLSPTNWVERADLAGSHAADTLNALLEKNLLISEGGDADVRDRLLRDTHWRSTSAAMHYASRWHAVDTEEVQKQYAETVDGDLLDQLGPAPAVVRERVAAEQRLRLPAAEPTPLDALLDGRVTCRNFETSRAIELAHFSAVLYRAFGARVVDDYAPGVQLLKKGVPSAGGLHPTEAYLLVQRVESIEPGLYHYHPVDHALEPIRAMPAHDARTLALQFVAAQPYFAEAQVMVVPVGRFFRNFWKYRNHAKAYRALILDVGHLSQTLYLAATELGLAAFITAAVNEVDIEQAFGLDPLEEGPLAVCGFGIRAKERSEVEFDPLNKVWKAG